MTTLILFGGTSDLATRKLYPALASIDRDIDIIGTSRTDYGEDGFRSFLDDRVDDPQWEDLRPNVSFAKIDFYNSDDYERLRRRVGDDVVFYLATLPSHFAEITRQLDRAGFDEAKVAYEKPFGDDLAAAEHLNTLINDHLDEERVYRVDHYLSKSLVDNLSILRFTNVFLEPIWNSLYIDHVQIVASEAVDVQGRGEFYDAHGAVEDFFQSHLLQLTALTGMEEPASFDATSIRDEKTRLLEATTVADIIVGQYDGYEDDVGHASSTESLTAIKLDIDNERWQRVPFYLMTGKALEKKHTEIYVEFKNLPCDLFDGSCTLTPNALVINLHPDGNVYFRLNAKDGNGNIHESTMEYEADALTSGAYENVFTAILDGKQHSFVRHDEIEEAWRIVEEITMPEPFVYERGAVPEAVRAFNPNGWYNV
jgi:glucose-6-phosphate 1-dehydrogenase